MATMEITSPQSARKRLREPQSCGDRRSSERRSSNVPEANEGTELTDWTPSRRNSAATRSSTSTRDPPPPCSLAQPNPGLLVGFGENCAPSVVERGSSGVFANLAAVFSPKAKRRQAARQAGSSSLRSPRRAIASTAMASALIVPFSPFHCLPFRHEEDDSCEPPVASVPVLGPVEPRNGCEHWLALSGAADARAQQPGLYGQLCLAPAPPAAVLDQVELDLGRTDIRRSGSLPRRSAPGEEAEAEAEEEELPARREALRRVLHAFARHDPTTGYVQGMGDIAAKALLSAGAPDVLVTAFAEAAAFWWLRHVTREVLPRFFSCGMSAVWVELGTLRRALGLLQPHLTSHLEALGCDLACFAPAWYLTLFQRILHPSECGAALTQLASRRLSPTHLALGILLGSEKDLLGARTFEAVTCALCSAVDGVSRRLPPGVLRAAADVAAVLPSKELAGEIRR